MSTAPFELGLNEGQVLLHLARHTYTTLTQVVVEGVQNAIDADCKAVWIEVDMRRRSIIVANDGSGVDVEQFQTALGSVGKTAKNRDRLGRFGLGLISPLDKCRYYTFTSRPNGEAEWLQWRFEAGKIQDKASDVSIPFRRINGETMQNWRHAVSLLSIHGFTKDRQTAALDPNILVNTILEKLGSAMRKQGVTGYLKFKQTNGQVIEEDIKPSDYTGDPLPLYVYQDEHIGRVEFRLYRAIRTIHGRKGQVSLSEAGDYYPVTWAEFAAQSRDLLKPETIRILGSGYFEGDIRAEGIELSPSRNKFMREADAFMELCVAIEEWLKEVGQKVFDEEREERSAVRYQELGVRTLNRLDELLHDQRFGYLKRVLMTLERRSSTTGRVSTGNRRTKSQAGSNQRTKQGGTHVVRQVVEASPQGEGNSYAPGREANVLLLAEGPKGRRRQFKRRNLGVLTFSHDMPEGSEQLWELDAANGVIFFNVRHPIWLLIDEKDHMVMHLQEWIALQVLTMMLQPEETFPTVREFIDRQVPAYVEMMIVGGHKRSRSV